MTQAPAKTTPPRLRIALGAIWCLVCVVVGFVSTGERMSGLAVEWIPGLSAIEHIAQALFYRPYVF